MQVEQHMRNLSVIRGKVGKARTPKDHEAISKEITEAIKKIGCNPNKIFYTINNNRPPNFSVKKAIRTKVGTKKIGEGEYGEVFFGCVDKECKKDIAIKVQTGTLRREFRIGKVVSEFGGTKVYAHENCKNKHIMYSEYVNGGTLEEFMNKRSNTLRPIHYRSIITQVLYNLYKIHKQYPSFRHNDLHIKNILVNIDTPTLKTETYKIGKTTLNVEDIGLKLLINDYGLSTMKNIVNPDIADLREKYGIDPNSHPMYDAHLFLNAMFLSCVRMQYKKSLQIQKLRDKMKTWDQKLRNQKNKLNVEKIKNRIKKLKDKLEKLEKSSYANETIQFISRILPYDYRGVESDKIEEYRMRFGVAHPKIPSFEQIFTDPYFRPYKSTIKKRSDPLSFLPKATPLPKQRPKPKLVQKQPTGNASQSAAIRRAKAVMNKEKQKKAQPIKRRVVPPPPSTTTKRSPPKVTIAPKGYVRINGKKCTTYKKKDIVDIAKKAGINVQGKTIEKICESLKIKYVK